MSDVGKKAAAAAALDLVEDGMRLGLGTGSTAAHFVILLGERVKAGLNVSGVATSQATAALAHAHGVPLFEPDGAPLDLAIDGADEIDPALNLIKGGGAALLREKIVAAQAKSFVVIADATKRVRTLGRFPLPVEVTPFGWPWTRNAVARALREVGGVAAPRIALRGGEETPARTDGGNLVLDCACGELQNLDALAAALVAVPGVVEHGLFIGMAREAIVADATGAIERIR